MSALQILELVAGYIVCGLVGIFGILALYRIYKSDKSGLELLLSEKDGSGASMSRFQLFVFTFVIALSFFLIVVSHAKMAQGTDNPSHTAAEFPDVPGGVLALLGISASSYTVSKAIQPNINTPNTTKKS